MSNKSPINQEIYAKRRQILLNKLPKNSLVVIASGKQKQRNADVFYPFRASSDFLYLLGLNQPDVIAIFAQDTLVLFLQERNEKQTIWEGDCLGIKGALEQFNANIAYDITQFEAQLPALLTDSCNLAYDITNESLDKPIKQVITHLSHHKKGLIYPTQYHLLTPIIAQMRLIKDAYEIRQIQQAIDISIIAHKQAMKTCQAGQYEYEIASVFDGIFSRHNAQIAYPHIVAGGINACTLHYINNNAVLKDGYLLLIDAGAEINGYASDITRTFPVNGCFSPEQKVIYQIVLEAQKSAIKSIKPNVTINIPHQITSKIITKGLREIGLLKQNSTKKELKQFFMHGTGHWLGLEVHDVGSYQINAKHRVYQTGMITTVEPGIYIYPNKEIDPKWWGIGVRIEDDVLVTDTGHQVLSQALVKEVNEIEQLMLRNL